MERISYLVVGGGALGTFAAYHLATAGCEVVLVERKTPGVEASGHNAGSLAIQNKPLPLVPLAVEAVKRWKEIEDALGIPPSYHQAGGLRIAEGEEQEQLLRAAADKHRAVGVPVETIAGGELRNLAPYLGESVTAANWCELDGYNDALTVVARLGQALRKLSVDLRTGTEVFSIGPERGHWRVDTNRGTLLASRVLLCAGAWTSKLLRPLGIDLGLRLRNNQMMVTEPVPPMITHMLTHILGHLTLKQVDAGTVLIGGGWPGRHDLDRNEKRPDLTSLVGNARVACRVVPVLRSARVVRSWAGVDARMPDQLPRVGAVPGHQGLFIATGCFGTYTLSPVLGEAVALAARTGKLPAALASFGLEHA